MVVENWPRIAERRKLGFPLTDLWRELTADQTNTVMSYKAFRSHVLKVAAVMDQNGSHLTQRQSKEAPRGEIKPTATHTPVTPDRLSPKEKLRAARDAKDREADAVSNANQPAGKLVIERVEGAEIWMGPLGERRSDQLIDLNRKLRAGTVPEEVARPILDAARREGWSKRLGIAADQLTEEDMNGPW